MVNNRSNSNDNINDNNKFRDDNMTVERLERVMWRLRKWTPGSQVIHNNELRKAIMKECGTDDRTLKNNRKALIELGWIKTKNKTFIELTGADMDE